MMKREERRLDMAVEETTGRQKGRKKTGWTWGVFGCLGELCCCQEGEHRNDKEPACSSRKRRPAQSVVGGRTGISWGGAWELPGGCWGVLEAWRRLEKAPSQQMELEGNAWHSRWSLEGSMQYSVP